MLPAYLAQVRAFDALQHELLAALLPLVRLRPRELLGYHFTPTEHTFTAQLRAWPSASPLLPIASWVEPIRGELTHNGADWEFRFHGTQELTFIEQATGRDVTTTFTPTGAAGITEWTMRCFLASFLAYVPALHAQLFAALVARGELVPVPPKSLFEEEVFVLRDPASSPMDQL